MPTKLNCGKGLKVARVALPLGPVKVQSVALGRGIDSLMWPNYLIACEPPRLRSKSVMTKYRG